MKNYARYDSVNQIDCLYTFPESEDPEVQDTVTVIDSEGEIKIGPCALTSTQVENLGAIARDEEQFSSDLDYYGCNCDAARIGKRPNSLPPPVRD